MVACCAMADPELYPRVLPDLTEDDRPDVSLVVPVFNERDNVKPLIDEIVAALRGRADFEIVYVDDCSKDDTLAVLQGLKAQVPELRVIRHISQSGQSTAVRTGVKLTL